MPCTPRRSSVRQPFSRTSHVGVKALPNSLTGYSINVPPAGSPAPAGAPRLRWATQTTLDDPLFPDLVDGTKNINPTADPNVYFLGQGILKTAQAKGFPPVVLDAFGNGIASTPIGSVNDIQSTKLGLSASEGLFNIIWNKIGTTGPGFVIGAATTSLDPITQDKSLTDNTSITTTRYYKWKFTNGAEKFVLGNGLPLGRIVLDIRITDASGSATAFGAKQVLLQQGQNAVSVAMNDNAENLVNIDPITLPK